MAAKAHKRQQMLNKTQYRTQTENLTHNGSVCEGTAAEMNRNQNVPRIALRGT